MKMIILSIYSLTECRMLFIRIGLWSMVGNLCYEWIQPNLTRQPSLCVVIGTLENLSKHESIWTGPNWLYQLYTNINYAKIESNFAYLNKENAHDTSPGKLFNLWNFKKPVPSCFQSIQSQWKRQHFGSLNSNMCPINIFILFYFPRFEQKYK